VVLRRSRSGCGDCDRRERLSVIGGIVVGVVVSKYTIISSFGPEETGHHAGVIAYWIAIGMFTATAWLGLAVGLKLLAYIARSHRAARNLSRAPVPLYDQERNTAADP